MTDKSADLRIWQSKLYELQLEAPKPHLIPCQRKIPNRPPQYGLEYHGSITRHETENLLEAAPNGAYLIRQSQRGTDAYTLVIWFDKIAKNYKLFYDAEKKHHYVGEKRFDTIECLVADGLIHFHIETRGAEVLKKMTESSSYEHTPFYKMRYHTFNMSKLCSLSGSSESDTRTPNVMRTPSKPSTTDSDSLIHNRNVNSTECEQPEHTLDSKLSTIHSSTISPRKPLQSIFDFDKSIRYYREFPPSVWGHGQPSSNHGVAEDKSAAVNEVPPSPPPRTASTSQTRFTSSDNANESHLDSNKLNNSTLYTLENDRFTIFNPTFTQINSIATLTTRPDSTNLSGTVRLRKSSVPDSPIKDSSTESPVPSHRSLHDEVDSPRSDSPAACSTRSASIASSLWGQSHPSSHPINGFIDKQKQSASNGPNNHGVLELLERYQLPKVCSAADQVSSVELVRKKHEFKVHTYRGPHWCDFCTHFIWGLVAQGVRCADCGFQAHKRCVDRVPDDCLPDIKQMKRVFGVDLTNLTIAERKPIPTILERCVNEVERRGLTVEGLYRIPGNHDRIEHARATFDKDCETAPLSPARIPDVNVITSLIKSFLRQLPVPLITYEAHPKLLEIMRNEALTPEEQLAEVAAVLSTLPSAHYDSLRFFLRHIHRVAENHEQNMMRAENLAVVLTPSLMNSSYTNPAECLIGMRAEHALTVLLIREYSRLFPSVDRSSVQKSVSIDSECSTPSAKPTASPRPSFLSGSRKLWFLKNRHSVGPPLLGELLMSPSAERDLGSSLSAPMDAVL